MKGVITCAHLHEIKMVLQGLYTAIQRLAGILTDGELSAPIRNSDVITSDVENKSDHDLTTFHCLIRHESACTK
jgi:hypothetical protein